MTDNEQEIWKDIEGYEGLYQVSNKGRVRSLDKIKKGCNSFYFKKGKILNCNYKNNRYGKVTLYKENIKKEKRIHRLVAEAFIPNPNNLPQVNHIDNDSKNNCVNNLEWVTASQNAIHAYKIGVSTPPMLNRKHNTISKMKMSKKARGRNASNSAFNFQEAKDIIRRKLNGEKRIDVYQLYKDKISFSSFGGIWYGRCYKKIWEEII